MQSALQICLSFTHTHTLSYSDGKVLAEVNLLMRWCYIDQLIFINDSSADSLLDKLIIHLVFEV